ncbi:hypothetical protein [Scytonema sp. HK-05]|nr:hypothetical protein [Scytonema sp. HK-05]
MIALLVTGYLSDGNRRNEEAIAYTSERIGGKRTAAELVTDSGQNQS